MPSASSLNDDPSKRIERAEVVAEKRFSSSFLFFPARKLIFRAGGARRCNLPIVRIADASSVVNFAICIGINGRASGKSGPLPCNYSLCRLPPSSAAEVRLAITIIIARVIVPRNPAINDATIPVGGSGCLAVSLRHFGDRRTDGRAVNLIAKQIRSGSDKGASAGDT